MTKQQVREGFAVLQLNDKRWYPVRIEPIYSASFPDGTLHLSTFLGDEQDLSYPSRKEALAFCQRQADLDAEMEQERWERMVAQSDAHPERCAHYLQIIEEITGSRPFIHYCLGSWRVYSYGYTCRAGRYHGISSQFLAPTREEGLESVANEVYASSTACKCSHLNVQTSVA